MQNAKKFYGCVPKCQFFHGVGEGFLAFFFFLPLEAKIQNGEWIPFAKNFAWCLVPFCKMMGQNPKFFG
jgi:hypothetical protein